MLGWSGHVIRVNLDDGSFRRESVRKDVLKRAVGGVGLATEYLFKDVREKVDPLSRENTVNIFTGPFTGTPIVSSGRFCLVTASPLTNYYLQSHCGGHFGPELKYSGHDGIVIEGASSEPVYILIDDDHYELKPAGHLWGQGVKYTARSLTKENDPESKVLSIGPAGERQIPISNVKSDVYRSLGRGGTGAVFGSKNLKAIVVRGTLPVDVHDAEGIVSHITTAMERSKTAAKTFTDYGTANAGIFVDRAGALPTKNFQLGRYKGVEAISGTSLKGSFWKGRRACFSCPIGCSQYSVHGGIRTEGPEYETIFALGSNLLNDDPEVIIEANEFCNDMGIDTISAGVSISWLMEACERGILDEGIEWGDGKAIMGLMQKIAKREGIGADLSNGVRRAADAHGGSDFAIHVKGLELPGYDPRVSQGMALAYAVSNRGGCHLRAPIYVKELFQRTMRADTMEGKVGPLIDIEDRMALMDCLIICRFASRTLIDESFKGASELLAMVTGEVFEPELLEGSMDRLWAMQRVFNIRQGMRGDEDTLPERFFRQGLDGHILDRGEFDGHILDYYSRRGCDERGIPTGETLRRLGILADVNT